MADELNSKQKILKSIQGMNFLTSGASGNTMAIAALPETTLKKILRDQNNNVDQNVRPSVSVLNKINPFAAEPSLLEREGAKKNLFDIIGRAQDGTLTADNTNEIDGLQGVLHSNGYDVTFDKGIDNAEKASLTDLKKKLDSGLSLTAIANQNFKDKEDAAAKLAAEAKAKAEQDAKLATERTRAAQTQAGLQGQVSAGLNYAGYLNDDGDVALAMRKFINSTTDHGNQVAEMNKAFVDGKPTAYAAEYLRAHTQGIVLNDPAGGDRLKNDLESGNEERIQRAQHYMNLQGRDLPTDGKMDKTTFDAGQAEITKPLTIPPGLIRADGTANLAQLNNMSVAGELYLPIDKLSDEDRAAALAMPLAKDRKPEDIFSREQYIANRLITDNPAGYQAILDEENARRAKLELKASIELPEQKIASDATLTETNEKAQNPLGLKALAQDENFNPETRDPLKAADGVTTNNSTLVFSDTDKTFQTFLGQLDKDGVTMKDALVQYHIEIGQGDYSKNSGFRQAGLLTEALGYERDHKFDLKSPAEVKALLTGVTSFSMAQQETLKIATDGSQNYIEALQANHKDIADSIDRVSKGVAPEEKPAVKPLQHPLSVPSSDNGLKLSYDFRKAHDGGQTAEPKVLDADNNNGVKRPTPQQQLAFTG